MINYQTIWQDQLPWYFFLFRLCLEQSQSSEEGVEVISKYLEAHGPNETKYQASYIICDCEKVWLLNTAGKLWAAQLLPSMSARFSFRFI